MMQDASRQRYSAIYLCASCGSYVFGAHPVKRKYEVGWLSRSIGGRLSWTRTWISSPMRRSESEFYLLSSSVNCLSEARRIGAGRNSLRLSPIPPPPSEGNGIDGCNRKADRRYDRVLFPDRQGANGQGKKKHCQAGNAYGHSAKPSGTISLTQRLSIRQRKSKLTNTISSVQSELQKAGSQPLKGG